MKNLKSILIACFLLTVFYTDAQTFKPDSITKKIPMAKVAGQNWGKISAKKFRQAKGIEIATDDKNFEAKKFEVVRFEMFYIAKRQDGITTETTGSLFSDRMKSFIEMAKSGDIYCFSNIYVMGTDSVEIKLRDMTFKIK